ncbi:heme ABC transporter ATP-binding protein [Pararhodonellum marinum]|uniref:heme ABC transporter ATP-binding protein n=1 Tax=Pararhodonellum marinum TaxID=2755358 RepID=UPI001890999E|nr:heme ABC transporter ATP-binding protein [Pararhodonellum marinum]
MLEAQNIHFCIQNRPILDQANLSLRAGELTVILGPNGAGKSTLFKILSGEIPCKYGSVKYNDRILCQFKPRQLAEVRAVMPQHSSLTFPFTAHEVVALGLMPLGHTYSPDLLERVMKATHTWDLRNQLYGQLSGGEKQRVQLARVLTQIWEIKPYPRYLLLDEPTSSMDISQQHHVLEIVSQLKKRNIGVLAILHDLNLASQYADQIVLMKNGLILRQGTVEEVMTEDLLEAVFDYPIRIWRDERHGSMVIGSLPSFHHHQSTLKIASSWKVH